MRKDAASATLFDKRVVERNIAKGMVTREEYERLLGSLPDVADQAEVLQVQLGNDAADQDDLADQDDESLDDESDGLDSESVS
jgi:hypothetical protein